MSGWLRGAPVVGKDIRPHRFDGNAGLGRSGEPNHLRRFDFATRTGRSTASTRIGRREGCGVGALSQVA